MPSYTAPVKDMMFLFEKLRDNKNYNELEKYNEVSADLVKDILEEAAKINQNLILPLAKAGDENPAILENGVVRTPPGYKEAYQKYIEDGWTSLSCDPKYGGQGMPKTVSAFFDEMLSQPVCHLNYIVNLVLVPIIVLIIMLQMKLKINIYQRSSKVNGVALCV